MGGSFQMNDKVLLGIIDNKRPDCLDATIQSLEDNLFCDFFKKVIKIKRLTYLIILIFQYVLKYCILYMI
jgi:hypothetical protein